MSGSGYHITGCDLNITTAAQSSRLWKKRFALFDQANDISTLMFPVVPIFTFTAF